MKARIVKRTQVDNKVNYVIQQKYYLFPAWIDAWTFPTLEEAQKNICYFDGSKPHDEVLVFATEKKSRKSGKSRPSYSDIWHSRVCAVPGCVAPGGIVDSSRPIPGVWMCGDSSYTACPGVELIEGKTFGPYGKPGSKCKHVGELGECLAAGRATSAEELELNITANREEKE